MKVYNVVAVLLMCVFATGCADMFKYRPYARHVKKMRNKGGVVAMKLNNRAEDQQLADSMMAQTCGSKKVEVLEEGEVSIGTITKGKEESHRGNKSTGTFLGLPVTSGNDGSKNTTTETVSKKEWQIKYKCK